VFFGLATLNLRVDSCMFEKRFLMLAERLALEFLCRFFGITMSEGLFLAVFFGFQLEARCVSKNDGLPYWFCVVVMFVSCWRLFTL
jgi:hypothetical protein